MTQHYVGTKIVEAWPQSRPNGDGTDELGYAVKYADGYISWSPLLAFEAAYLPLGHIGGLAPHQQRMLAEYAELDSRLKKLCAFLESEAFQALDERERELLQTQARAMNAYHNALLCRIERFQYANAP